MCLFVIVWLNMFFCRLCGFDVFYSFFALPLLHCAVVVSVDACVYVVAMFVFVGVFMYSAVCVDVVVFMRCCRCRCV